VAISIYFSSFLNITAMTEYEWERARVPAPARPPALGAARPRPPPVAEYVALEYPRESVTWFLHLHLRAKRRP
jgi:hypothetical protein